jgi:GNAT superfamily N-acetyltransferase
MSSIRSKEKPEKRIRTLRREEGTAHLDMLDLCYDPWGTKEEWRRRYILHPDFDVTENVVIIEENNEWSGGGTAWFREALLKNGKAVKVYSAGDLYVHPSHRSKGIYSTAMRSLNQLAQKKGAVLGFAYPSIYRLPAMALPKYGFVQTFHPMTHVLVLNPEKFFQFMISRAKKAFLSKEFNGIRLKLTVIFNAPDNRHEITHNFHVENGEIHELGLTQDREHADLAIRTEAGVLLQLVSAFYMGKRALMLLAFANLLKRRLGLRVSLRLVRLFLGL